MPLSENTFEAQYQVEDGYVTGARPQRFKIHVEDLENDASDDALREFYDNEVDEHFKNNEKIYPSSEKVDQFVAWAKAQIAHRKELDQAADKGLPSDGGYEAGTMWAGEAVRHYPDA
jgi:hypothetical protein